MASIYSGNLYNQSNGGGYISKLAKSEASQADAAKDDGDEEVSAELAAYRQTFVKTIQERVKDRGDLSRAKINLDIDNESFEKMRTDSAYEQKVLDLFDAQLKKNYPLPPKAITITADAGSLDAAIDYGQSDDPFTRRNQLGSLQKAYLRNNVSLMRNQILDTLQNRLDGRTSSDLSSLLADYDFYA